MVGSRFTNILELSNSSTHIYELEKDMTTFSDLATYLPVIGVPVGGAIAWVWNEMRKNRKEKDESDITRERTYADRLEQRLRNSEADVERLSKEILTIRIAGGEISPEQVLREFIDNDPGISWVKKRLSASNFVMVRVSAGYAKAILKGPAEFYDGKHDSEVWDAETAKAFVVNDEAVHTSQEGRHIIEGMAEGKFIGRKFPLRISGSDYIVGIGTYESTSS